MSSIVPPIAPTMALNFEQCRSNADAAAMIKRYGLTFGRASDGAYFDRGGTLRFATTNEPRVDFSDVGVNRGLIGADSHINQIRNNSMVGAVVGTPGTFPTNWTQNTAGLTRGVVAIGTENGVDYIDLRLHGTATGVSCEIRFDPAIVALTGQTWTESVYLKKVAEPLPPVSYGTYIFETTDIGGFVSGGVQTQTVTSTLTRFTQTRTLSGGATTARVVPNFRASVVNGQSYDFTIRIGLPQMETGPIATEVIRTTNAAGTKAADTLSGASLSSLIGQSELNIFAKVDTRNYNPGNARVIADLYEDANNYIRLQKTTGNAFELVVVAAGSTVAQITDPTGSRAGVFQVGARVKANDFQLLVNGSSVGTDVAGAVPAVSKIGVGHAIDASLNASLWFGDRIGKLYLFNRALTTAVNQNITRNI